MKKLVVLICLLLSSQSYATRRSGNANPPPPPPPTNPTTSNGHERGNGGAGLRRNGRLMTFYSAELYVEPVPMQNTPTDIPQLDETIQIIQSMPYLPAETKIQYARALIPSESHQYYKVTNFDNTTKARILAEFTRVTNQPVNALELFAITDVENKTTFLLPGFYELSPADKQAALFHEVYWILHPELNNNYQQIVNAEMAFQAVVAQPNNSARILDFLRYTGGEVARVLLAIQTDAASGVLRPLMTSGDIPLLRLFGQEYLNCLTQTNSGCGRYADLNLYNLSRQYPNSMLMQLLWEHNSQSRQPMLLNGNSLISSSPNWKVGTESCVLKLEGIDQRSIGNGHIAWNFRLRCGAQSYPYTLSW